MILLGKNVNCEDAQCLGRDLVLTPSGTEIDGKTGPGILGVLLIIILVNFLVGFVLVAGYKQEFTSIGYAIATFFVYYIFQTFASSVYGYGINVLADFGNGFFTKYNAANAYLDGDWYYSIIGNLVGVIGGACFAGMYFFKKE